MALYLYLNLHTEPYDMIRTKIVTASGQTFVLDSDQTAEFNIEFKMAGLKICRN